MCLVSTAALCLPTDHAADEWPPLRQADGARRCRSELHLLKHSQQRARPAAPSPRGVPRECKGERGWGDPQHPSLAGKSVGIEIRFCPEWAIVSHRGNTSWWKVGGLDSVLSSTADLITLSLVPLVLLLRNWTQQQFPSLQYWCAWVQWPEGHVHSKC